MTKEDEDEMMTIINIIKAYSSNRNINFSIV